MSQPRYATPNPSANPYLSEAPLRSGDTQQGWLPPTSHSAMKGHNPWCTAPSKSRGPLTQPRSHQPHALHQTPSRKHDPQQGRGPLIQPRSHQPHAPHQTPPRSATLHKAEDHILTEGNLTNHAALGNYPDARLPRVTSRIPHITSIFPQNSPDPRHNHSSRHETPRDPHSRVPNTVNPRRILWYFPPKLWIQE